MILAEVWPLALTANLGLYFWLCAHVSRWNIGVICRFAGHTNVLRPYGAGFLDMLLFMFLAGFISFLGGLAAFIPMKLLLGAVGASPAVTGFILGVIVLIALVVGLFYCQMAFGVYALTGSLSPVDIFGWMWICMPRLILFQFVNAFFVVLGYAVFMGINLGVTASLAAGGLAAGISAKQVVFLAYSVAYPTSLLIGLFLGLMSNAMFGTFLYGYQRKLEYHEH